ncbi:MAG TPA: twin-arginine translocase TatA/TatE family subunit [Fimbriimonas sp.]|nr:twin-arginine translocase TatA/TatE family subunit [Fimbriimonas sp.]
MTYPFLVFGLPGGAELWILGGAVLLLFGSAKIPALMRSLGQGVGELKKGLDDSKKAFNDASKDEKEAKAQKEEDEAEERR